MITGEQIKQSVIDNNITDIDFRECSLCRVTLKYHVRDGELFFYPGCGCADYGAYEPRTWESAAELINMQTNEGARKRMMDMFGLKSLESLERPPLICRGENIEDKDECECEALGSECPTCEDETK